MRVQIAVTGRVQGVGFRFFALTRARALGLSGFARNLPNGQVEVLAEGARDALEAFLVAMREGPPGAAVRGIQVDWEDVPSREREFVIR
ncbi:MAG TPA: acylphosphatase [bacterium]|nr:acylphosphatase [bacterium]